MSSVPPSVPPAPIQPGAPPGLSSRRGCARNALVGCGAFAALIALCLVAVLVYLRRHPEKMTDALMEQVQSNFAADVTAQEKEDLRAAYTDFRRSLVDGTASRQSLQDMRGVLLSRGLHSSVSREQVRSLTGIFRGGSRPARAPAAPASDRQPAPAPTP